jgi:hypothetical protein
MRRSWSAPANGKSSRCVTPSTTGSTSLKTPLTPLMSAFYDTSAVLNALRDFQSMDGISQQIMERVLTHNAKELYGL